MKLTKQQLKQMIKEELKEANGAFDKLSGGEAKEQGIAQTKQVSHGSGINDAERGIIQKLQAQLANAAQKGSITSGKVFQLANLLSQELQKINPDAPQEEQQ